MKREYQKKFFRIVFERGGIWDSVFTLLKPYGGSKLSEKHKEIYESRILEQINQIYTIEYDIFEQLFEEIEDNLNGLETSSEKERYLHSIVVKMKPLAELLYIDESVNRGFARASSSRSEELKREYDLLINDKNEVILGKSEEFGQVYHELNESFKADAINEAIERRKAIFALMHEDAPSTLAKGLAECYDRMNGFVYHLDALCLKNRIDLNKIQKDCGVKLWDRRDVSFTAHFIGSYELTYKYIEELEENNQDQCNTLEPVNPGSDVLPTINTEKYNPNEIYDKFNNVLFECPRELFNCYLVEGKPNTMSQTIRMKATKKALFKKFIHTIVKDPDKAKGAYFKAVFAEEIKSNDKPSRTLPKEIKDKLKLCEVKR